MTSAFSPKPTPARVRLALFVVQLAFASQAVESKVAMLPRAAGGLGLSPVGIAMVRMLGGTIVFQLLLRLRSSNAPIPWRDHAKIFGLSLLGITINQTLFLYGLSKTQPFVASLLSVMIPIASAAVSVLLGRESWSARLGAGLLFAAVGVVVLTGVGSVDRGALLVLANSVSYAFYVVLSKELVQKYGALTVIGWVFTWGGLAFLPFGAAPAAKMISTIDSWGVAFLAYAVLIPTVLAYLANAWALGHSTASLVTIFIPLQPLIAATLSWVQLGTKPPIRALIAAPLILLGIRLVSQRTTGIERSTPDTPLPNSSNSR